MLDEELSHEVPGLQAGKISRLAKLRIFPSSQKSRFPLAYFAKQRNDYCMATRKTSEDSIAEVFKALGHPARVRILRALLDGERCVCDLVAAAGLGWSTVSRHLSIMKAAGVLHDEKRGKQVIYRLELPCAGRFLACLEYPERYPEMHVNCACVNA